MRHKIYYKWLNSFSINALRNLSKKGADGSYIYPETSNTSTYEVTKHVTNPRSTEVLDVIITKDDDLSNDWKGLSFLDLVILNAVWSYLEEAEECYADKTIDDALIKGIWRKISVQQLYKLITHNRWAWLTYKRKRLWIGILKSWASRMNLKGSYQARDSVSHKIIRFDSDDRSTLLGAYKMIGPKEDYDHWIMWFYLDENSPIDYIIKNGRQVVIPDDMTDYPTKIFAQKLAEYFISFRIRCTGSSKAKMSRKIRLLTLRKTCRGKINKSWLCSYMDYLKHKGYIVSWEYTDGSDGHKVISYKQEVKK